jgi:hypothetical protein
VWSVQNGFNKLIQTILMPDVGTYDTSYSPDGVPLLKRTPSLTGQVTLGVDSARFYRTSWDSTRKDCGYAWWECMHHVGFYLDKVMAIEALSDSQTDFVARSTPEDLREWRIGYYGTFYNQIGKINLAILGEDWSKVAPYMENGELVFPNYAGDLKTPHASPVDPFATFSVKVYWQVLGMARFPSSFDQSFVDESRVFIMGTGSAPQVENDWIVTYRDPRTGLNYGALKYTDGKEYDGTKRIHPGAGEALINRANMLLARSFYCDDTRSTPTTADNCVPATGGHTGGSSTAMLMDHNELLRALVSVNNRINFAEPYNPSKP